MTNRLSFTEEAWQDNLSIYHSICEMPFNQELSQGTLAREKFQHYILQDAHYLEGFGRALALLASKGWTADHIVHFAKAAETAIIVERSLHATYFQQFSISDQQYADTAITPVCDHYISYLLRITALEPFEVGLAAVLPCFWIYREVGKYIHQRTASGNPYQAWVDTYAGVEFEQAVEDVIRVVDEVATQTSAKNRAAMLAAFKRSTQLEWMFWDSAYRLADWPIN